MTTGPILLFGLPRSGTTWVGKIFDSHPRTLYRHEPDSVVRMSLPLVVDAEADACAEVQTYYATIPGMSAAKVCAKLPLFPKAYLSGPRFQLFRLGVYASKVAGRLGRELPVFANPRLPTDGSARLVWKSIESLGRLGLIHRCLDEAFAVHIVRHPCGYVASVLRGEARRQFVDNNPSSEDYDLFQKLLQTPQAARHGLDLEYLKSLTPEARLAWRWVLFNEKARDDLTGRSRHTLLVYDALCEDPLGQARTLFDACGLEWNEQTERFVRSSVSNEQDAYYSVFKDPKAAANKWRRDLSTRQIDDILAVAERSGLLDRFPT